MVLPVDYLLITLILDCNMRIELDDVTRGKISGLIEKNKVLLFMKGSLE